MAAFPSAACDSARQTYGRAGHAPTEGSYGKLPLRFEVNRGQTDGRVKFLSRGKGYDLFLTATEAVIRLRGATQGSAAGRASKSIKYSSAQAQSSVLRMKFVGANAAPRVAGVDELPGVSNYLLGKDPAKWRTGITGYRSVRYSEVYQGVDVLFYGNGDGLEYDIVVAPQADPRTVRLAFDGARGMSIDAEGNLVIRTRAGLVVQRKPYTYQQVDGRRDVVASRFVLKSGREVGFEVAEYDSRRPLVIDPTLVYSTYLGGSGQDVANDIAVDATGSAYVIGSTTSLDFPTTPGAVQTAYGGSFQDAFVTKLNPAGNALVYSTYLGGNNLDLGFGVVVDATGSAYVTGQSRSANFPVTPGAFQTTLAGGVNHGDPFAAKLTPAGDALVYSTFLGGSQDDRAWDVAIDAAGRAFVVGETTSPDFPLMNQFQGYPGPDRTNAFVSRLNAAGSALTYSTYLAGSTALRYESARTVAVDAAGKAYAAGYTNSADFPTVNAFQPTRSDSVSDGFVAKIDADLAGAPSLVYSTYLGGGGDDEVNDIAVDSAGHAFAAGRTASTNFPTTPGAFQTAYGGGFADGFVAKLGTAGNTLVYSTYLGGNNGDAATAVALDAVGNAYVAGDTYSFNFPTASPFQPANALPPDAFVAKLNAGGSSLVYSTYLGGSNHDDRALGIAVDGAGNAYVTGVTFSNNFPLVNPIQASDGGNGDAFVAKIDPIADADGDTVPDPLDNCPLVSNASQANADGDSFGDACDACPSDPANDADGDGVCGDVDNCPAFANADQTDTDGDLVGDACDADDDNDGVADVADNCQFTPNANQANADGDAEGDVCDADDDGDGVPDASDNCPLNANPDQANNDLDAQGDVCDPDDDNDGVPDVTDNCPLNANPGQADTDDDGEGDACESDTDGDGVLDGSDACPGTPPGAPVNSQGCPVPSNADQCKNGGWQFLYGSGATPFQNQGDCIKFMKTGR